MSKSTEKIWKQYEKGLDFNNKLRLAKNVQNNENFFIGRQWEGVASNDMSSPHQIQKGLPSYSI